MRALTALSTAGLALVCWSSVALAQLPTMSNASKTLSDIRSNSINALNSGPQQSLRTNRERSSEAREFNTLANRPAAEGGPSLDPKRLGLANSPARTSKTLPGPAADSGTGSAQLQSFKTNKMAGSGFSSFSSPTVIKESDAFNKLR
jgi:hypothetical protein